MNFFSALVSSLVAFLYPARCAACEVLVDEHQPFCALCRRSVERIERACPRCALPTLGGVCLSCLRMPPPFASARAAVIYGGAVAEALRRLKFTNRTELASRLASLLEPPPGSAVDLIVPMPLARDRLASRGYNQAALLALALAGGTPRRVITNALYRVRSTRAQAQLTFAERRTNVRGAFFAERARVAGKRIVLVDDIMTSGETARAATRALLAAGATRVDVLTVARAVP